VESVVKLQNLKKKDGIAQILTETQEDWKLKIEVTERKKTNAYIVKVLIDNVMRAIKINASMLSVQDIHDHLAKYTTVYVSWCSKNYAFEFVVH
jgi:phage FluMu gp28-like protein